MDQNDSGSERGIYTRRRVLIVGSGAAMAAVLAACGGDDSGASSTTGGGAGTTGAGAGTTGAGTTAAAGGGGATAAVFGGGGGDGTIKIGFTAPLTGPLAGFGDANEFILAGITELVADGLMIGDQSYTVEIIERDVESNSDTAATRASELILDDGVDMMLAIATPEMINPVADQCEANGVPCLSTLAPWQPYFFPRGGDPAVGFDWTYHFFWGAEQLVGVFVEMWDATETNKVVGLLCPNDPDGNALADPETGFPAGATAAGYTVVDPGRFQVLSDDFSAIIGQFKEENVEVVVGIPLPPDFATFWTQAEQQDFNPKVVTMAKAILFPSAVEALGDLGDGLASEIWWTPGHPFTSSLTGISAQELADSVHGGHRKAVDAVRRFRARALRADLRRARSRRQHRQGSDRRGGRGHRARHHRRPAALSEQKDSRRTSPRRRSSAVSGRKPTAESSSSTWSSRTTSCRRRSP